MNEEKRGIPFHESVRRWGDAINAIILQAITSAAPEGIQPADLLPILRSHAEEYGVDPKNVSQNDITDALDYLRREGRVKVGGRGYVVKEVEN